MVEPVRIRVQMRYLNGAVVDTLLPRLSITPSFWIESEGIQVCFKRYLVLLNGGEDGGILKIFYRQIEGSTS